MGVKSSWKQTAVGPLPQDWDIKPVGDLGLVVRGGSPRPAGDPRYFNGDFVPWLTVAALTNIPEYQLTVSETAGYLTEAGSKLSRTLIDDTVIIANSGATLGVAKLLAVRCCANDGIAAIINQQAGNKAFVCFYINSQTKRLRQAVATGNGQPNLNTRLIRSIFIPFPPLPEQRAIAEALSDVDALLAGLDRLIAKKRDLKQAAMQQLLTGQTRLSGFRSTWDVMQIGEAATKVGSGMTPAGGDRVYRPTGRPFLRSQNVGWGCLLLDDIAFIDDATHCTFDGTEINVDDVFLNITGASIGRSSVADSRVRGGNVNQHVCIIRANQRRLIPRFLSYFLLSPLGQRQIDSFQAGGNRQGLNFAQVRSIILPAPPVPEQAAIAELLKDMDADLDALERRLAKTRLLKQAMMQELLTGRTRLVPTGDAHA